MRLNHVPLIFISGSLWLIGGIILLSRGLAFLVLSAHAETLPAMTGALASVVGSAQQASLCSIFVGLLIGFLKGRFILSKTASRLVYKIISLPAPVALRQVYGWKEAVLIGIMVCLGMLVRWLPLHMDVRGLISVAIGSALINGAVFFFRQCLARTHAK